MRKFLILLLALALAAGLLSACGQLPHQTASPPGSTPTSSPAQTAEPTATDTPKPTDTPEPTPSPTPDRTAGPYEKGILTDTTYESGYLGIHFTLPDGFVLSTQQELNNQMGLTAADVEAGVDYAQLTDVYEMMTGTANGTSNITLLVEKLTFSGITIEQYINALKTQLAAMDGYTLADELSTVEFAGQTYTKLDATLETGGTIVYQNYLVRKIDNRIAVFIVTCASGFESEIDTLMAGFTAY